MWEQLGNSRIAERPHVVLARHYLACNDLTERVAAGECKVPDSEVNTTLVNEEQIADARADEVLERALRSSPECAAGVDVLEIARIGEKDAIAENAEETKAEEDCY